MVGLVWPKRKPEVPWRRVSASWEVQDTKEARLFLQKARRADQQYRDKLVAQLEKNLWAPAERTEYGIKLFLTGKCEKGLPAPSNIEIDWIKLA